MHVCAEAGQVELFKFFVDEFKGDIMARNHADETPFIIAAKEGRCNIVELYIEEYSKNIQHKFYIDHHQHDGWTALLYASMNGFAHLCETLVKKGRADVNHVDKFKRTALHWACRFDSCKVAEVLLNLKASTSLLDMELLTPKALGLKYNNKEVASIVDHYASAK